MIVVGLNSSFNVFGSVPDWHHVPSVLVKVENEREGQFQVIQLRVSNAPTSLTRAALASPCATAYTRNAVQPTSAPHYANVVKKESSAAVSAYALSANTPHYNALPL